MRGGESSLVPRHSLDDGRCSSRNVRPRLVCLDSRTPNWSVSKKVPGMRVSSRWMRWKSRMYDSARRTGFDLRRMRWKLLNLGGLGPGCFTLGFPARRSQAARDRPWVWTLELMIAGLVRHSGVAGFPVLLRQDLGCGGFGGVWRGPATGERCEMRRARQLGTKETPVSYSDSSWTGSRLCPSLHSNSARSDRASVLSRAVCASEDSGDGIEACGAGEANTGLGCKH